VPRRAAPLPVTRLAIGGRIIHLHPDSLDPSDIESLSSTSCDAFITGKSLSGENLPKSFGIQHPASSIQRGQALSPTVAHVCEFGKSNQSRDPSPGVVGRPLISHPPPHHPCGVGTRAGQLGFPTATNQSAIEHLLPPIPFLEEVVTRHTTAVRCSLSSSAQGQEPEQADGTLESHLPGGERNNSSAIRSPPCSSNLMTTPCRRSLVLNQAFTFRNNLWPHSLCCRSWHMWLPPELLTWAHKPASTGLVVMLIIYLKLPHLLRAICTHYVTHSS
jgi:hypothetical protein